MSRTRLLIVAPGFHDYGQAAAKGFEAIGFDVEVFAYDHFGSTAAKLRNKVAFELPDRFATGAGRARFARWATRRAAERVRTSDAERVLVIRGDVLLGEFWDALSTRRLPTLLWLYDELSHMTFDTSYFAEPLAIISYSRSDVRALVDSGFHATYGADAFDSFSLSEPRPSNDVVFVGARYPSREVVALELVNRGVNVHMYGRDWSHHLYDRLRTWDLRRPAIPASRDLDRQTAYAVMGGALAALNIHEDQSGFTMRTFEIPGAGGLQLIDRADVDEFYDPDREVAVFSEIEELVDLCRRARADRIWRDAIADAGQRRTLAQHTFVHRARELAALWD